MTIFIGDALEWLKKLPSESVNCIVTSPPYFQVRDYGVTGQYGLEDTPQAYVDNMVAVFREARRVLRSDGVAWINIADTFASGEIGRHDSVQGRRPDGKQVTKKFDTRQVVKLETGIPPKNLLLIPQRLSIALQEDGWYIRNMIIWHKPNPMPESVTDRCTKSHEYVFLCAKSERYYFDADAIREPHSVEKSEYNSGQKFGYARKANPSDSRTNEATNGATNGAVNPLGRNKRDVWSINTQGSDVQHFATMPLELAETCIKAGCPETVCAVCGAPYVRETEKQVHVESGNRNSEGYKGLDASNRRGDYPRATISVNTLGFNPTCTCNGATRPGVVLDPFGGAGTTALAAVKHNRHYQLIELNIKYVEIAQQRIAAFNPMQTTQLSNGMKQRSLFEHLESA